VKVSVVIPAKNEATSLKLLLPEIKGLDLVDEIIVVNDGSNDNTSKICRKFQVKEIRHPISLGNGAGVKAGARAASGDVIVFMDGDGQHQAKEIEVLLEKYKQGYDLVVGARDARGQASLFRRLANGAYNRFASWMTGHKVEDLTSGFRVVNAEKFREFLYMLPNGFSYPTTSTMAFFRSGYTVAYEPVEVLKRDGESHINIVSDGVKFLLIIFKVATLYSPLKVFFTASFSLFGFGLGYYLYTFLSFGRFTNMGMVLMLSAVLVFLIGLVSEQISTLFYKK